MAKFDLTAQHLRSFLSYDPESGVFRWKPRPLEYFRSVRSHAAWHAHYCGKVAGGLSNRYGSIHIIDRAHFAHRLAWLYVYGVWPTNEIDHMNGCRTDNRIANLRDVLPRTNKQNIRRSPANRTLPLGVFLNTRKLARKYSASVQVNERTKHLGYFDTAEEAHEAYVKAKRANHLGCTI